MILGKHLDYTGSWKKMTTCVLSLSRDFKYFIDYISKDLIVRKKIVGKTFLVGSSALLFEFTYTIQ